MTQPTPNKINMDDIFVESYVRNYSVNTKRVSSILRLLGAQCGLGSTQINVLFVGPQRMRTLNKRFRGKDKSTDVLSFPQKEWRTPIRVLRKPVVVKPSNLPDPLGDIVISLVDAKRNAKAIGQPLSREVCFLLVHGFLHLCGHDHIEPKDEKLMLSAQRALFRKLEAPQRLIWSGLVSERR